MTTPRISRIACHGRFSSFYLFVVLAVLTLSPQFLPAAGAPPTSQKLKASDPYALIFGTVWSPDDHPLYGIRVKIGRAHDKRHRWEVISNHSGEFAQRVPAGKADYVIWADLKGVKTADGQPLHLAQKIDIHVEYDERVDIGLHLSR